MYFVHLTLEWSVMISWKKYRPRKDIFGIIPENDLQLLDRLYIVLSDINHFPFLHVPFTPNIKNVCDLVKLPDRMH